MIEELSNAFVTTNIYNVRLAYVLPCLLSTCLPCEQHWYIFPLLRSFMVEPYDQHRCAYATTNGQHMFILMISMDIFYTLDMILYIVPRPWYRYVYCLSLCTDALTRLTLSMIEEKSKLVAESGTKILFLGISLTAGEAFVAFVDEESFADAEAESFADSFGVSLAAPDAGSSFTSFTSFDSFAFSFTDSKVERFSEQQKEQ